MKWALRMIMNAPMIVVGIMMISTVARTPKALSSRAGQNRARRSPR